MTLENRSHRPVQRSGGLGSRIVRIEVDEWAEIHEESPDTTFQFNAEGSLTVNKELLDGVLVRQSRLVLKFASRIPSFTAFSTPLYLAVGFAGDDPQAFTQKAHGPSNISITFSVQPIKTDFNTSTVTWNNVPTPSGTLGLVAGVRATRAQNPGGVGGLSVVTGKQRGVVNVGEDPENVSSGMFASGGIETAFGMIVSPGELTFPVNTWTSELRMTIQALSSPSGGARAFFQFGS